MYEMELRILISYMQDCLSTPAPNWSDRYFADFCYQRWAANEILERMLQRPFQEPIDIAEDFILEMMYYRNLARTLTAQRLFEAAIRTAEDVRKLFQKGANK